MPGIDVPRTLRAIKAADEHGVIRHSDPASAIVSYNTLAVTRQLEMLNLFVGLEQANKYAIVDGSGTSVGFIAEEERGMMSVLSRQLLRTRRVFNAVVMDEQGNVALKIHRPFAWINSRIFISTGNDEPIGEVQQEWHPWRRRYNLFVGTNQFARMDAAFLSWVFELRDSEGALLGIIDRNFSGFAREIFTDTGHYVLRMDGGDGINASIRPMTLDERAVALAAAITVDFDYFSRHSQHGIGGGFFPIPFFMGGGSTESNREADPAAVEQHTQEASDSNAATPATPANDAYPTGPHETSDRPVEREWWQTDNERWADKEFMPEAEQDADSGWMSWGEEDDD